MTVNSRRVYTIALAIVVLSSTSPTSGMDEKEDEKDVLDNLRELVIANEEAMSLIKFNFRKDALKTRSIPYMPVGGNIPVAARPLKYTLGVWAQNGNCLYKKRLGYYDDHTLASVYVQVVDGEVLLSAKMADEEQITSGSISPMSRFRGAFMWFSNYGLRPIDNERKLSQLLAPSSAAVHEQREYVDGYVTVVVDVRCPEDNNYFQRLWIDEARGLPLRSHFYEVNPDNGENLLAGTVDSIKLHQLPNGAWIPVDGIRTAYRPNYELQSRNIIDVNSITIDPNEIDESLFTIDFPEDVVVWNSILGVHTKGGEVIRRLKKNSVGKDRGAESNK